MQVFIGIVPISFVLFNVLAQLLFKVTLLSAFDEFKHRIECGAYNHDCHRCHSHFLHLRYF